MRHVARHQPRGAGAGAPAHRRLGGGLADARMVGEAEVVVRAQQQDGPAVEHDARPLGSADHPHPAVEPAVAELAECASMSVMALPPLGRPRGRDWALRRVWAAGPLLLDTSAAGSRDPRTAPRPSRLSTSARRSGSRRLAVEPAAAVVRPRVRAVVGLARDVEPELLEHRAVVARASEPSVVRKLPIITPLRPALTASALQLAEVLDAAAAEPEQRVRQDQPEDRDPLDRLPRVHVVAVAELRPRARVEQVDRHARRVDLRQLEGHLDALLARLAEVEDAADAGLQARLADRVDRPQPALVADRRRDLGVVGLGRLDVVVDALDAGLLERLRARRPTCGRSTRSA